MGRVPRGTKTKTEIINTSIYIHTKGIQTTHGEIWNNKKFIFSFLYAESRIVVCVYNILYAPLYT